MTEIPEAVVETCALAMVAEDPIPMSMFDAADVRALARAALQASPLMEVVEALRPFAAVVADYEEHGQWCGLGDNDHVVGRIRRSRRESETGPPPTVTIGDMRRARAALAQFANTRPDGEGKSHD